jgi:hypothetical protein
VHKAGIAEYRRLSALADLAAGGLYLVEHSTYRRGSGSVQFWLETRAVTL